MFLEERGESGEERGWSLWSLIPNFHGANVTKKRQTIILYHCKNVCDCLISLKFIGSNPLENEKKVISLQI